MVGDRYLPNDVLIILYVDTASTGRPGHGEARLLCARQGYEAGTGRASLHRCWLLGAGKQRSWYPMEMVSSKKSEHEDLLSVGLIINYNYG